MKYNIKYLPFQGGAKILRGRKVIKTFYSGCDPLSVILFFLEILNKKENK